MAFVMGQPTPFKQLSSLQQGLQKKPKKQPKAPQLPPSKTGRQFGQSAISGVLPKG